MNKLIAKVAFAIACVLAALGLSIATAGSASAAVFGTVCNGQGTLSSSPIIWTSNSYPGPMTEYGIYHGQCDGARQFTCTKACTSPWGYTYPTLTKIAMSTTGTLVLH